jgi:hypothetical protein
VTLMKMRLVLTALYELLRYDLLATALGRAVLPADIDAAGAAGETATRPNPIEAQVDGAILLAAAIYVKPVLCLQRSTCAVRMLRRYGVPARLVIGFRRQPFFCHAWVEVEGRVANDSPVYRERLTVLYTG